MCFNEEVPVQTAPDLLALHAHFQREGLATLREGRETGAAGQRLPLVHGPVPSLQKSILPCKTDIKLQVPCLILLANDEQDPPPSPSVCVPVARNTKSPMVRFKYFHDCQPVSNTRKRRPCSVIVVSETSERPLLARPQSRPEYRINRDVPGSLVGVGTGGAVGTGVALGAGGVVAAGSVERWRPAAEMPKRCSHVARSSTKLP